MEHLWSLGVATVCNRSRLYTDPQKAKDPQTVAYVCHRSPVEAHGKEGVCGSSPQEGFLS
jgi:hypothetical protein